MTLTIHGDFVPTFASRSKVLGTSPLASDLMIDSNGEMEKEKLWRRYEALGEKEISPFYRRFQKENFLPVSFPTLSETVGLLGFRSRNGPVEMQMHNFAGYRYGRVETSVV